MISHKTIDNIKNIILCGSVSINEPMKLHTTFKAGGNAAVFVIPGNLDELSKLLKFLTDYNEEYYIVGNGSNLLISDNGYEGIIINIGNSSSGFSNYSITDCNEYFTVTAGAGCLMSIIGRKAAEYGASGFEALSGIPGCVGGACIMNAGAYDTELKDVIEEVYVLTKEGSPKILSNKECGFRYRGSIIEDNGYIVTGVKIRLNKSDKETVLAGNEKYRRLRAEKQPLEYPSAGSTFKRPKGTFAGKLISDCNLKGYSAGGAKVSEKHAGFIINFNNATATDIYKLICIVKDKVYNQFGIELEPEVKMLGKF